MNSRDRHLIQYENYLAQMRIADELMKKYKEDLAKLPDDAEIKTQIARFQQTCKDFEVQDIDDNFYAKEQKIVAIYAIAATVIVWMTIVAYIIIVRSN